MKLCLLLVVLVQANAQVIPHRYFTFHPVSVNGSSATGNCSSVNFNGETAICTDPASSVLFDGVIPTLTGDMWASQLFTLRTFTYILFDFTGTPGYDGLFGRLEVVMFNCPKQASTIIVSTTESSSGRRTPIIDINIDITSCDSLVRMCTPIATDLPIITLDFIRSNNPIVYFAEVTFYASSGASTCPPDTIITTAPPTSDTTSAFPTTTAYSGATENTSDDQTSTLNSTAQSGATTASSFPTTSQCGACPSSSLSIILASVITAILTALLATVIFVLVQIALWKSHHNKSTPGHGEGEAGTLAGEVEEEYDEVIVGGEGGVASDPTYMEVGTGGGGGNTFKISENEAYRIHLSA